MLSVKGKYKDGRVIFREKIKTEKTVDVIVTYLEEVEAPVEKKIDLKKFSFEKARKLLDDYEGSLSEAVIQERRSAV